MRDYLKNRIFQINNNLWIGGTVERPDWAELNGELGLTAILSLQIESIDQFDSLLPRMFLWLPTVDGVIDVDTFRHGVGFANLAFGLGHKLYVHCRMASNRAPQMATAILISNGLEVNQAVAKVKRARPAFNPKQNVIDTLAKFREVVS